MLRCRGDYKYIVNEYKKFEGVEAIRVRDQQLFLEMLNEHIKNEKYFLFGCDSCTIVEQLYIECLKEVKEADKDKFLIITVNNKLEIKNASEQFKISLCSFVRLLQQELISQLMKKKTYLFIYTGNP